MQQRNTMQLRFYATARLLVFVACLAAVLQTAQSSYAATPAEVLQAVRRGRAFLLSQQDERGGWNYGGHPLGATALAAMALVETGAKADSESIQKALKLVRQQAAESGNTYDISLAIMFLDRTALQEDEPLIRELAGRLVAGQLKNGSWGYQNPQQAGGALQFRGGVGDNSNTQFAVLALWVARRHGAKVDDALQRAGDYFRNSYQKKSPGWGYRGVRAATPPMTCAGLIGVAAAFGSHSQAKASVGAPAAPAPVATPLNKDVVEPGKDPVVRGALDYLGSVLEKDPTARRHGSNLYFLWSLERVAVIYGLPRIGVTDWHDWGGTYLVKRQAADGSWNLSYGQQVSTSLALLFLNRANVASDLTLLVSNTMRIAGGSNIQDLADRARGAAARRNNDWETSDAAALLAEFKQKVSRQRRLKIISLLEQGKGANFSAALASAVSAAPASVQEQARQAYAARMTRMTARTLLARAKSTDTETRLAVAIAAGRKRARETTPMLIELLLDRDARVGRAAHKSLKDITGQNFGGDSGSLSDRFVAQKKWKAWWAAQK